MKNIIEFSNIEKRFKNTIALNNINMNIKEKGVHGILGHNGAGKTTMIRIIAGIYKPTNGSVKVFGMNPVENGVNIKKSIGVLSENTNLYESLNVYDNLLFYGEIYGLKKHDLKIKIDSYLKRFDILNLKNKLIKECSTGNKKKVGIIRTILHDPKLLLLDEASNGLDPISIQEFHELIKELVSSHDISAILCSHNLHEVKNICDDVTIIKNGSIIFESTLNELRYREGRHRIIITTMQESLSYKDKIEKRLQNLSVSEVVFKERTVHFYIQNLEILNLILDVFIKENIYIVNLSCEEFNLEYIYRDSHKES